ncbi:hypothetical protein SKAU_G00202490 [Synaphobranchus kaupii]|uniref:Uncharacterized protein n=1 Tax=Synaphobranchus kaupii TaxID=118154 RepID=A0A9Q1FG41_SYNKA|nr:hypothetical protein SKAU_G00202490 [Synaphobranchus kaupii]
MLYWNGSLSPPQKRGLDRARSLFRPRRIKHGTSEAPPGVQEAPLTASAHLTGNRPPTSCQRASFATRAGSDDIPRTATSLLRSAEGLLFSQIIPTGSTDSSLIVQSKRPELQTRCDI